MNTLLFNDLLVYAQCISDISVLKLLPGSNRKKLFVCGFHINYQQVIQKTKHKNCGKCVNQTMDNSNILNSLLFNNLFVYSSLISDNKTLNISISSHTKKLSTCGNHITYQIISNKTSYKNSSKCVKCINQKRDNTSVLSSLLFNNLFTYTSLISCNDVFNLSIWTNKKLLFTCGNHITYQLLNNKHRRNCGKCINYDINHTNILNSLLFNNLNIYSLMIPDNECFNISINSNKKKLFNCGFHINNQYIHKKTYGNNCALCNNKIMSNENILNSLLFNNLLVYSQLIPKNTINLSPFSNLKQLFTCGIHINNQIINNKSKYINSAECSICYSSKLESCCHKILNNLNLKFEKEKTYDDLININKLRYDIYIPIYNILIELDGIQHFENVDFYGKNNLEHNKITDNKKNLYAKNNNIRLLRISWSEINNMETHIVSFIDSQENEKFIGIEY